MFLWIPIVLYLFASLPARKAVIISFLVAWLFLPQAELMLPGVPDYNKISATCYGILLATFIFDVGRFQTFKFGWLDLPMLIWCLCPFVSSMTNDLGAYDGFSAALDQTMRWGVPYFLGRIYLNNLEGLRQLAMGIFVGGLVYVPLCLIEVRLSPQLHRYLYGGFPHSFGQTIRDGGYRPNVFMETGLMVGAFMLAATLIGIWFWQTGMVKQLWNIPMSWLVWTLIITFALLKSYGAYSLLIVGVGIMFIAKQFRTALPVYMIIVGIGAYLYINAATETYSSDQLVEALSSIFPPERIQSYEFRLENEELLVDRARQQIWFGWGGFGRSRQVINALGERIEAIQDSLWVIAFGANGMVGLVSCFTAMLLPVTAMFVGPYSAQHWFNRKVAGAAVLGIIVVLYMVDCVLNAMINPIYILACGGIASVAMKRSELLQATRQALQGRRTRARSYETPAS
ncbi:O-antigen ligase domain-containing protein [Phormidium tenue FACHB-886]|nr:O-antigen ligase domain-containing protein [Phormidium tenue FACHB-886]